MAADNFLKLSHDLLSVDEAYQSVVTPSAVILTNFKRLGWGIRKPDGTSRQ